MTGLSDFAHMSPAEMVGLGAVVFVILAATSVFVWAASS